MDKKKIFGFYTKILVLIAGLIFVSLAKSQENTSESPKVLELLVIDKTTQEPISDVELTIRFAEPVQNGREVINNYKTDTNGQCKINLEDKPRGYLRIIAAKDSYASSRTIWSKSSTVKQVPSQYTLTMMPAIKIGGKVQNEQGEPIEDVTVSIYFHKEYNEFGNPSSINIFPSAEKIKTDSKGYWEYDKLPGEFNSQELRIFLEHQDYISDNLTSGSIPLPVTSVPPLTKLHDLSSVMVMKSGVSLSGRVINSKGEPIQNAMISEASDRLDKIFSNMRTDKDGNFNYKNVKSGKFVLAVQAKGYSPDTQEVDVRSGMSPIEFRLEPGQKVAGKIVDKDGNPLAGAAISVESWRGTDVLKWSAYTDNEGKFQWDEAPEDEVLCSVSAQNYMGLRDYLIISSDDDLVITMPPPLKIHGKVTDAKTGEIIPEFKMISGNQWGQGSSIYWDRDRSKTFTDGNFENEILTPYYEHYIQIEAEGYLPAVSRAFQSDEGDVVCDLKLQKAEGLSGVVLLPDEKPAEGAEVILCTPGDTMYLIQDRRGIQRSTPYYVTKEDGKFTFSAQMDKYIIFVFHKDGYAKIPYKEFEASSKIILEPYTTLKGKFSIKNEPKEGQKIYLTYINPEDLRDIRIAQEYRMETDADGNFEFKNIPPGQAIIYWEIRNAMRGALSHGISCDIKSGQINNITIGGKGRSVTGKILIPDYIRDKIALEYSEMILGINSPNNPYTQIVYSVKKDGSFHIGDVPAGDYTMVFSASEAPPNGSYFPTKRVGILTHSFSISETDVKENDEPLDIGELEFIVSNKEVYIPSLLGKALPELKDFDFKQADNKKMLICFFDIEQRPSRNCVIELSKKAEGLKSNGIEVLLIQSTKVEKDYIENWLKENEIEFTLKMIETNQEATKFDWGVKALPWLILTDKEHVVTDEGFSINELDGKL